MSVNRIFWTFDDSKSNFYWKRLRCSLLFFSVCTVSYGLWNSYCNLQYGSRTRLVRGKIVVSISYSTGRLTPLYFKAFISGSCCHWFWNNLQWICFFIHQRWGKGRHLHEQRLGEWTRRSNKQNPDMPASQNRSVIWLIWLWRDGKVQQSSRWKRREGLSLFQTF